MKFSVLCYNVLYNQAVIDIKMVLDAYKPDILCLQEIETNEVNLTYIEKMGYKLADYSNSFIKFGKIYGVATYYKSESCELIESNVFNISRTVYERIIAAIRYLFGGNPPRTFLETTFKLPKSQQKIRIYNTHLTLYGSNGGRLKQINKTLENLDIEAKLSMIIVGDFNYFPYNRRQLEEIMSKFGFTEATKDLKFTATYEQNNKAKHNLLQKLGAKFIRRFFKGKLKIDYIFYKNLRHRNSLRVNIDLSDHYPIISTFEI